MDDLTAAPLSAAPDRVSVLGRSLAYKHLVAIVYVSAIFIDTLDVTIVNVALPSIGRELNTSSVEWIVLGYTLSLAVVIPASGWLGDRIGTKRVFCSALAIFVVASGLCGAAQNIEQLIAFRVIQGIGGGMLTPVGIAMLYRSYPQGERAKAAVVLMVPTVVAPALGPILGGLITTHVDWRWIFYVNLPVGAAALTLALVGLREHREPSAHGFDLGGFALSGAGLALVVYALSEGPNVGWSSAPVLGTGIGGVVALAAMVRHELTHPTPMLDLRLLGERLFRQCNLVSFLSMGSFIGLIFLMPLYLQLGRGYDALDSGLATFTQPMGVLISTQIAGRLYPRVGPRRLIVVSLVASALVVLPFLTVDLATSRSTVQALMFLRGLAVGIGFVPMQAASYANIAPADNGRASSIFSTGRQVSASLAIAVLATVLTSYSDLTGDVDPERLVDGFHAAVWVVALMAALGAVAALFIRDRDAAATMRPRAAISQPSAR